MEKITGLIRYLLGRETLPKSFRLFLKAHGSEPITKLEITRTPIDNVAKGLLNVLTLGKWDDIKKKAEVDKLFHVALRINDKYYMEKTAQPNLKAGDPIMNDETESLVIPVRPMVGKSEVTIAEFIERGMKQMGDKYSSYNGFTSNCQDFIRAHLRASALLTEGIDKFLKQDIKRLIEETPSLSQYLGEKITDLARTGEGALEELRYRRGGAFALGGRYEEWYGSLLPADQTRLAEVAGRRGVSLDQQIFETYNTKTPFKRGGVLGGRKKFLM